MNSYDLYNSNSQIFKQFILKDTLFVYYNCPQREKILQLYSQHNQFLFTLSGKKIFSHGDDTFFATKNSTFLLKRSAFLQELPDDYTGFEVLVFYIKDHYLKTIFEEYRSYLPLKNLPGISENMFIQFEVNEQIYSGYQSMIPYFERKNTVPDTILEARFKELMFNILTHPANRQVLSYIHNIADDVKTPIWEIMESNYMYNLKIADYASLANRSMAAFKRDFEKHYQTSPGIWLIERRMKRAKLLLETSHKSIGDVAFETGFVNLSHFSRVFKNKTGLSPMEYRNQ
ncbi:MAG TPA: AraC family transcriptional regulator [Bacteroidales bacterium]|nr:AraC family transcriptional regulator [Bacteroidales bacterium]